MSESAEILLDTANPTVHDIEWALGDFASCKNIKLNVVFAKVPAPRLKINLIDKSVLELAIWIPR